MDTWAIIQGEVANLYLCLISAYLVLSLFVYLAVKLGTPKRFFENFTLLRVRLAKGLFVTYVALGMLFTWALIREYGERRGHDVEWMNSHWIPISLKVILALGMLCTSRLLQPDRWGRWAWAMPTAVGTFAAALAWWSFTG